MYSLTWSVLSCMLAAATCHIALTRTSGGTVAHCVTVVKLEADGDSQTLPPNILLSALVG